MKSNDPVQQLAEAERSRDEILKAIPDLQADIQRNIALREGAQERLNHAEGDLLIGATTEAKVADKRKALEQALTDERTAEAVLRKANADVIRMNEAIGRLGPQVHAARIKHYREKQGELLQEALPLFEQLEQLMDQLHDNYQAALAEFPATTERRKLNPYPVAAGLDDMSWFTLRTHDAHVVNGGQLAGWRKRVADFFNPPTPAPPKARRVPNPPSPPVASGNWHALQES